MKKRKKRPDLNTTKAEAGTFFPGVQKKLAIGKADNAYEIEADNMADTVVNAAENSNIQKKDSTEEEVQQKPLSDAITPIQKKEMTEEEPIQKQEMVSEEEPVQKMEEEHE